MDNLFNPFANCRTFTAFLKGTLPVDMLSSHIQISENQKTNIWFLLDIQITLIYGHVFFWDYSTYSNSGIDGTCVLLGAIPILEWTDCYSVHSAPNSRMNRIIFWRENCASAPISFDLFYWELILCVFCYSYSKIGINRIVPKERALCFTIYIGRLAPAITAYHQLPGVRYLAHTRYLAYWGWPSAYSFHPRIEVEVFKILLIFIYFFAGIGFSPAKTAGKSAKFPLQPWLLWLLLLAWE